MALKNAATMVFERVLRAMQEAEELGGPEVDDYLELMQAIVNEANARRAACAEAHKREVYTAPQVDRVCVILQDHRTDIVSVEFKGLSPFPEMDKAEPGKYPANAHVTVRKGFGVEWARLVFGGEPSVADGRTKKKV